MYLNFVTWEVSSDESQPIPSCMRAGLCLYYNPYKCQKINRGRAVLDSYSNILKSFHACSVTPKLYLGCRKFRKRFYIIKLKGLGSVKRQNSLKL